MKMPIKIKVEFCENGWTPVPGYGGKYCASAMDDPTGRIWQIGDTPEEAIGNLIACYASHFGVELSGLEGHVRTE